MADPYIQVFVTDWIADPDLDGLDSIAAIGLWAEMMFRMQMTGGKLILGGKKIGLNDHVRVAKHIRCIQSPKEARSLMDILNEHHIFSVDDEGTIYSRRIVRDIAKRDASREYGKRGGNPSLAKSTHPKKPIPENNTVAETTTNGTVGLTPPLIPSLNHNDLNPGDNHGTDNGSLIHDTLSLIPLHSNLVQSSPDPNQDQEGEVRSDSHAHASTRNLPSPPRAVEKSTDEADDSLIADDEIEDLPASKATPEPMREFAEWWVARGIELGAISEHHDLFPVEFCSQFGGLETSTRYIAKYGLDLVKERSERIFKAAKDGKLAKNPRPSRLVDQWDKPDISGIPNTPRGHVIGEFDPTPPLPLRGFERDQRRPEDVPLIGVPRTKCPVPNCGSTEHTDPDVCPKWQHVVNQWRKNA